MEITRRHAALCGSLADYHRLLILYALAEKQHNVSELATRLGMPQPAISRHLKVLRECGVVSAERQGRAVYYKPADPRIIEAMDILRAVLTEQMRNQGDLANKATDRPAL